MVSGVHLLELFNGGSDGGYEEETSLGDVAEMAVLQQGTVPEREREGERGEREGGREGGREGYKKLEKQLGGTQLLSSIIL